MNHPWPAVPLGEVLKHRKEFITIDDSQEYKRCRIQLHAKGIVLRDIIEGARIKTKEQQVCRAGEFLVAEIDAKVGGFGLVPEDLNEAIVSSHYFLFEINQEALDKGFLDYYIRTPTFRDQVSARGTTNYAAIRPRQVLEYLIPLPPLPEQRRIVAKIEELAAKTKEANKLRNQAIISADKLIGSEICHIFSKMTEAHWKGGCLGDYVLNDCYGTSEKTIDNPSGTPILRMGNIQGGRLVTSDLKYIYISDKDREKLILKSGDILVNRTNSAELVGKCAVFNLDSEYGFASYLIRLRLDLNRANPYLVALYINSPIGRDYMFRERKQMTGQANVNAKKLKSLPMPLPPLDEQRRIVAYLDGLQARVDALKKLQAQTAAELDALLPAILDRAFKGEL
ncbi:MAG: hypothetical protein FJ121_10840 [Deltaproteobacteria bacterium]|nr:hypothetical protein [Deltaproteobacteria bacterium]